MPRVFNPKAVGNTIGGAVRQVRAEVDDVKSGSVNNLFSIVVGLGGAVFNGVAQFLGGITGPFAVTGAVSATTTVAAGTTITAGTSLNGATLVTTSDANIGGNVNAPNGTLISAYARAHSVVTSYVAAYIDGSGNFLSTPSALRMKRDIATKTWTREQRDAVRVVAYRLRAAYILADMRGEDLASVETLAGVIGEDLLAAGLDEFVVLDDHGRVFTVRYELLALVAIDGLQQAEARMDELEARLTVAGF